MNLFDRYDPLVGSPSKKNKLASKLSKHWSRTQQQKKSTLYLQFIAITLAVILFAFSAVPVFKHRGDDLHKQTNTGLTAKSAQLVFNGHSQHWQATNKVYHFEEWKSQKQSEQLIQHYSDGYFKITYTGSNPKSLNTVKIKINGPSKGMTYNGDLLNTKGYAEPTAFAKYPTDQIHITVTWANQSESFILKTNKNTSEISTQKNIEPMTSIRQVLNLGVATDKNLQIGANHWSFLQEKLYENIIRKYDKPLPGLLNIEENKPVPMIFHFKGLSHYNTVTLRVTHESGETNLYKIQNNDPIVKNMFGENEKSVIKYINFDREGGWTLSAVSGSKLLGTIHIRTYYNKLGYKTFPVIKDNDPFHPYQLINANWDKTKPGNTLILDAPHETTLTFKGFRQANTEFKTLKIIGAPINGGKPILKTIHITDAMMNQSKSEYLVPVTLPLSPGKWHLIAIWNENLMDSFTINAVKSK